MNARLTRDRTTAIRAFRSLSAALNGCVERNNGARRYEFYATWDIPDHDLDRINRRIDAFADEFNHFRPHNALDGQAPNKRLQFLTATSA